MLRRRMNDMRRSELGQRFVSCLLRGSNDKAGCSRRWVRMRLVRCRASDMWNCLNGRWINFFRIWWGYDEPPTCAAD